MNSSLINKIVKAQDYAQDPSRVSLEGLQVRFQGNNRTHLVELDHGHWQCDCDFFQAWARCSHTMALAKMLAPMLSGLSLETVSANN